LVGSAVGSHTSSSTANQTFLSFTGLCSFSNSDDDDNKNGNIANYYDDDDGDNVVIVNNDHDVEDA